MRKFQIIATRALEIDGLAEPATGDQVLGTIETECNVGSLLSCLQHRNARLVAIDDEKPKATEPAGSPPAEDAPPVASKPAKSRRTASKAASK